MFDSRASYIETLEIEQGSFGKFKWPYFLVEYMIDAHDISRRSKLNNGISREIQMNITIHSDVRFSCIIYRDPRN